MDIKTLAPAEAIEVVNGLETKEELRSAADSIELKYSGNTGPETLKKNLIDVLNEKAALESANDEASSETTPSDVTPSVTPAGPDLGDDDVSDIQIAPAKPAGPSIEDLLEMNPNEVEDTILRRKVIRAKALRLVRCRIKNLDPSDSALPSGLFTVVNKYTGKVSKVIPYGEEFYENGYHVPQILLNDIMNRKFALRKEVKGGNFGVKKYKTSMVRKFSVEILPDLTEKERQALAMNQQASGRIG